MTGTFSYNSGAERDYDATFYYDDAYFSKSSYEYNPNLSTMSLCFAMSAFASNEYPYVTKSNNARSLLEELGFTDFETNYWFTVKPTKDSIGVTAANKFIRVDGEDYTLIAVGIRGRGYQSEWASNFTIGTSGQHQGFSEARDNTLSFLRQYIKNNQITGNIKIWMTGFSRAAATTNMVAGALDGGESLGSSVTLDRSDLYAYCFECPAGALSAQGIRKPVYKNIFNIINRNDPVTRVAPFAYGFDRYGVDRFLPSAERNSNYITLKTNMLKRYNELESVITPYLVDNFKMKKLTVKYQFPAKVSVNVDDDTKNKLTQSAYLDILVSKLFKEVIKSRSNYVDNYQEGMRETFSVLQGTESEQWQDFVEIFKGKLKSNIGYLVASATPAGKSILGSTSELIEEYAVQSLNEAGITSYDKKQIHELAVSLASIITDFAVHNPNYTTTLICNIKGIAEAHYPELCLAWLQSMDKNYTSNAGTAFSSGAYRIVRINCPVDVEVFDNSNNLVAAIIADEPQLLSESSIISVIEENDQKIVYIPADADYRLKLTATGNGTVNYSINEFSAEAEDFTRLINYFDIDVVKGDTLSSLLPAYNDIDLDDTLNGSSTSYTLTGPDNKVIIADTDLIGTNATEAYYMVEVVKDIEDGGSVVGEGLRQMGEYAKLTAEAYEGYSFIGWYQDNTCIAKDSEYRFRVMADTILTARFAVVWGVSGTNTPAGTLVTRSGGTVSENGVILTFPVGAVESDIRVQIKEHSLNISLPDDSKLFSRVVDIVKDKSGDFLKPVIVAISLDNHVDQDSYDIRICYMDESTGKWIALDNNKIDVEAGRVTGEVDHFTKFAVIATPKVIRVSEPTVSEPAAPAIPSDISRHWAKNSIMELVEAGIISGYPDGTFQPDKTVTRAEFTVMLVKALQFEGEKRMLFADCGDHWAKDSIAAAIEHGLIYGYDAEHFGPDDLITREQAASIIARAANRVVTTEEIPFTDTNLISAWAKPGVAAAVKASYISGYPDNCFKPQRNTTRAEAAVMITRLMRVNE